VPTWDANVDLGTCHNQDPSFPTSTSSATCTGVTREEGPRDHESEHTSTAAQSRCHRNISIVDRNAISTTNRLAVSLARYSGCCKDSVSNYKLGKEEEHLVSWALQKIQSRILYQARRRRMIWRLVRTVAGKLSPSTSRIQKWADQVVS